MHISYGSKMSSNCCTTYRTHHRYKVTQQVSDLGWVEFYLDVSLILSRRSTHSAQAESGRQGNSRNQSQPNPGPRPAVPPCSDELNAIATTCIGYDYKFIKYSIWFEPRLPPRLRVPAKGPTSLGNLT